MREKTNDSAGGEGGKESKDTNLTQEKDVLDVDLSLLLKRYIFLA